MARLDWDRLRRVRPLDGADARIDPDGVVLWERHGEDALGPLGMRRLRHGVVVRRAKPATSVMRDDELALEHDRATSRS